jgi:hypothetical protein
MRLTKAQKAVLNMLEDTRKLCARNAYVYVCMRDKNIAPRKVATLRVQNSSAINDVTYIEVNVRTIDALERAGILTLIDGNKFDYDYILVVTAHLEVLRALIAPVQPTQLDWHLETAEQTTKQKTMTASIYDDSDTLYDAIQFDTARELYRFVKFLLRTNRGNNHYAIFHCPNGREIFINAYN